MCPETEPLARPRFSCYELVYVVFLSLEPSEVNKSDPFPHIHSIDPLIHRCVRVPRDA